MRELKQFIAKEYCLSCQGCCRFPEQKSIWRPRLLEEEVIRIVPFSKEIELVASLAQGDFVCQFLNSKDNRCKVYTIRPFDCRLYPFLINRRGRKVYLSVDLKCPSISKTASLDAYNRYVQDLLAFFDDQNTLDVLRKNPQIIQTYEDALDVFELKL